MPTALEGGYLPSGARKPIIGADTDTGRRLPGGAARNRKGQTMGWRRDDPNADAPQEAAEGLAASANIPVADASQVNAAYCLRFLRQIRDVSFATVDADGLPSVRIVDIMHAEDDRLYFLVPRGKALHAELTRMPTVAIVGQTTDFRSCRLCGCAVRPEGAEEQRRLVDWMFELNPAMNELYPGDSRYICDVFLIENGSGDYFDLGQKPIMRVAFDLGQNENASEGPNGGFRITDACVRCGSCAKACPQGCVTRTEEGPFLIEQKACPRCGLCFETCRHGAIERGTVKGR